MSPEVIHKNGDVDIPGISFVTLIYGQYLFTVYGPGSQ